MAGLQERDQELVKAVRLIKKLYPYPTPEGSKSARRRRRRKWRRQQAQVVAISERILEYHLGRSLTAADVELPDLEKLSVSD
uniref:Protein Rev n=1 Tax=Simian immunodeficiency virus TaxID=11723 RepID=Q70IG9_SIV|nr:rev protein [Simian immunodeficiency virus]